MKAFGVTLIILHVAISIFYGIFANTTTSFINISSIAISIFLALLIIVGFGTYLSFFRALIWSGIAFTFLNTVISVLVYPLANFLWTQLNIFDSPRGSSTSGSDGFNLFLSSYDNN